MSINIGLLSTTMRKSNSKKHAKKPERMGLMGVIGVIKLTSIGPIRPISPICFGGSRSVATGFETGCHRGQPSNGFAEKTNLVTTEGNHPTASPKTSSGGGMQGGTRNCPGFPCKQKIVSPTTCRRRLAGRDPTANPLVVRRTKFFMPRKPYVVIKAAA